MWRFSCKLLLSEHTITKDTQQPLDLALLLHGTLQLNSNENHRTAAKHVWVIISDFGGPIPLDR